MPIPAAPAACFGCSACSAVCPEHAIVMKQDLTGFIYPVIEKELCTNCGICTKVCPALHRYKSSANEKYYALRASLSARMKSTSGGAFQLLARQTLSEDGLVYGAAFDSSLKLRYCSAQTEEELQAILGTKYIQATPGNIFEDVRVHLDLGKKILFCGNPCLVHGLKLYLEQYSRTLENLTLADHVCYGCPSGGFWKRYLDYLQYQYGGRVESFSFRDKRNRDAGHTVSFSVNGKEHLEPFSQNQYLRIFNRGLSLRDSCITCPYCTPARNCDLTLGDFWGIEHIEPELDDGYGVSLVITHSEKGARELKKILPKTEWICTDSDIAMQPRLQEPTKPPSLLRKLFINDIRRTGVENCDMTLLFRKYGGGV